LFTKRPSPWRHKPRSQPNLQQSRSWVNQDQVDAGDRPGTTTADAQRIKDLEKENRELRRANQILKSASAFFAAELDRPSK
jgi:transposase